MGQYAVITAKSKDDKIIELLNQDLKNSGFTHSIFVTEARIKKFFNKELTNKNDYVRTNHVDKDGKFTLESYKKYLAIFNEKVGVLTFDYAFSRTSTRQLNKVARFIYDRREFLEPVKGMKDILPRGEAPKYTKQVLSSFVQVDPEPEKLPKEEQYIPKTQGGNLLCKSFSPDPFWVLFGKVDTPKFMKIRVYEDDLMNNIYRDKQNLAYMLIPQVTLDCKKFGSLTRDELYTRMWEMGLREHPNMFFPLIYHFEFANETPKLLQDVAKEFSAHYTPEELWERFIEVQKRINNFGYRHSAPKAITQLERVLRLIPSIDDKLTKK